MKGPDLEVREIPFIPGSDDRLWCLIMGCLTGRKSEGLKDSRLGVATGVIIKRALRLNGWAVTVKGTYGATLNLH